MYNAPPSNALGGSARQVGAGIWASVGMRTGFLIGHHTCGVCEEVRHSRLNTRAREKIWAHEHWAAARRARSAHDRGGLAVLEAAQPVVALLAGHFRRHAELLAGRWAREVRRPEVRTVDIVLRDQREEPQRTRCVGPGARASVEVCYTHVLERPAVAEIALIPRALASAAEAVVVEDAVDHDLDDCVCGGGGR